MAQESRLSAFDHRAGGNNISPSLYFPDKCNYSDADPAWALLSITASRLSNNVRGIS